MTLPNMKIWTGESGESLNAALDEILNAVQDQ